MPAARGCGATVSGRARPVFHGLNQRVDRVRARRIVSTFHDLFVLTGDYSTSDFRVRFTAQARKAAERSDLHHCRFRVHRRAGGGCPGCGALARPRRPSRSSAARSHRRPDARPRKHHSARWRHPAAQELMRLVEAFEQTAPDWRLVLVGSAGFGSEEIAARIAASPRRSSIQVAGYLDQAPWRTCIRRARMWRFHPLMKDLECQYWMRWREVFRY